MDILGTGPQVSQISRRRIQLLNKALSIQWCCFNEQNGRQCKASSQVDKSFFSGLTDFAVLHGRATHSDLRPCTGQVIISSPLPGLAHGDTSPVRGCFRRAEQGSGGPEKKPDPKGVEFWYIQHRYFFKYYNCLCFARRNCTPSQF